MRKAFSALGLLTVIAVLCVLYFLFWNNNTSTTKSIVNERKVIEQKQQVVNEQLEDIQKARETQKIQLKESLEQVY